jgi:hypothetical protein
MEIRLSASTLSLLPRLRVYHFPSTRSNPQVFLPNTRANVGLSELGV